MVATVAESSLNQVAGGIWWLLLSCEVKPINVKADGQPIELIWNTTYCVLVKTEDLTCHQLLEICLKTDFSKTWDLIWNDLDWL